MKRIFCSIFLSLLFHNYTLASNTNVENINNLIQVGFFKNLSIFSFISSKQIQNVAEDNLLKKLKPKKKKRKYKESNLWIKGFIVKGHNLPDALYSSMNFNFSNVGVSAGISLIKTRRSSANFSYSLIKGTSEFFCLSKHLNVYTQADKQFLETANNQEIKNILHAFAVYGRQYFVENFYLDIYFAYHLAKSKVNLYLNEPTKEAKIHVNNANRIKPWSYLFKTNLKIGYEFALNDDIKLLAKIGPQYSYLKQQRIKHLKKSKTAYSLYNFSSGLVDLEIKVNLFKKDELEFIANLCTSFEHDFKSIKERRDPTVVNMNIPKIAYPGTNFLELKASLSISDQNRTIAELGYNFSYTERLVSHAVFCTLKAKL